MGSRIAWADERRQKVLKCRWVASGENCVDPHPPIIFPDFCRVTDQNNAQTIENARLIGILGAPKRSAISLKSRYLGAPFSVLSIPET